jgi:hypothetical protein
VRRVTLHYHGTPITPHDVFLQLAGCCFCVSFADPRQVKAAHELGQSVMLDNGAFSLWKAGKPTDWPGFYRWADEWLDYPTTWAVIPDVIDGTVAQNEALIAEWPFAARGAPVWHLHEPLERLLALADRWPRVCFGSSGEYAEVGSDAWHRRTTDAWNALAKRHRRTPWVHMLRGLALAGDCYPFASLDSTNVARNHAGNHTRRGPRKDAQRMARALDSRQCPGRWEPRRLGQQGVLWEAAA